MLLEMAQNLQGVIAPENGDNDNKVSYTIKDNILQVSNEYFDVTVNVINTDNIKIKKNTEGAIIKLEYSSCGDELLYITNLVYYYCNKRSNCKVLFNFTFALIEVFVDPINCYRYLLREGDKKVTLSAEEMDVIMKEGLLKYMFGKNNEIKYIKNHLGQPTFSIDEVEISHNSLMNCVIERFVKHKVAEDVYKQLTGQKISSDVQKYFFFVILVIIFFVVIYLIMKSNTDEEI